MEARAKDLRKMRKHLSAPVLLAVVRAHFERIKEPGRSCRHTLTDNLMCGLALFTLKYPSMLQFDEQHRRAAADPVLQHNLARLVWGGDGFVGQQSAAAAGPGASSGVAAGVQSGLRSGSAAQGPDGFPGVGRALSAGRGRHRAVCFGAGALRYLLREAAPRWSHDVLPPVVSDGVGASVAVGRRAAGTGTSSEVRWGDQERLRTAGGESPIAGGTACASASEDGGVAGCTGGDRTGPYLQQCRELDMRYLIAVQPGSHARLFDWVDSGTGEEWFADDSEEGRSRARQLRLVHDVPLNATHRDTMRVTVLQARETPPKGRTAGCPRTWTWITDLPLTHAEASEAQACARSRWKIENETFNTLKNQGYELEHNFGHGDEHLATVLMLLMLLAS